MKLLVATSRNRTEVWLGTELCVSSRNRNVCGFSIIFYFERNYGVLKSKSSCFTLNKNIIFNKNETKSKMKNSTHSFSEMNLVWFSSYKNCELKIKLWWVGAHEKADCIFLTFILSERKFFNISVLPQFIVYWINFQNIHILLYIKKHYFIHFCCLFLKSSKGFSVSLKLEKNNTSKINFLQNDLNTTNRCS